MAKDKSKEYILCASVKYGDIIINGRRHKDCYIILRQFKPNIKEEDEPGREFQGFLTSKNRYVSREEAFIIAKEQEQIIHHMFDNDLSGKLTSEDLY